MILCISVVSVSFYFFKELFTYFSGGVFVAARRLFLVVVASLIAEHRL